jgi:hypothetical protein
LGEVTLPEAGRPRWRPLPIAQYLVSPTPATPKEDHQKAYDYFAKKYGRLDILAFVSLSDEGVGITSRVVLKNPAYAA